MARPKKEFSKAKVVKIKAMAMNQCHTKTIAEAIGEPESTIRGCFRELLTQKRAEGRAELRKRQNAAAEKGNPALLIFLGKNYLDQKDAKDINLGGEVSIVMKRKDVKRD